MMNQSRDEISQQVVCRPALPMDTPGMLDLTSQIWDGEDYVPGTWQDWLSDPDGMLAVAESAGVVAGFGKLTQLSPDDWWMEGLRVHPNFQGQRIASRLHRYLLEIWNEIGSGSIRFATVASREPVIHLAQVNGFRQVGEYSTFRASGIETSQQNHDLFSQIDISAVPAIVDWLQSSNDEVLAFGLMDLGWQFAPPREEYLEIFAAENQLWRWRENEGVIILVPKQEGEEISARIRMLATTHENLMECLADTHVLAEKRGFVGISWLAPLIPRIERFVGEAGFFRDWDKSLLIFEKAAADKQISSRKSRANLMYMV